MQEQATLIYGHRSLDSSYSWRGVILAGKEHRNFLGHWKCSGAHGWVHMQQFMEIKLKVGTLMTVHKVIWKTTKHSRSKAPAPLPPDLTTRLLVLPSEECCVYLGMTFHSSCWWLYLRTDSRNSSNWRRKHVAFGEPDH